MLMSFSEQIIKEAQKYLKLQLKKKFLVQIADGTLEKKRFNYWLSVDYPYLMNMAKVISIGKAKSEDDDDYHAMTIHTKGVEDEMLDHQNHAKKNNLSLKDISNPKSMGPIKYSYTRHQLSSAYSGDIGDLQASLLSCMWSYQNLASAMKKYYVKNNNPYKKWIEDYAKKKNLDSFKLACKLLDRKSLKYGKHARERMKNIFFISVLHETALWDEYYNMVKWSDII